jgi:hypothetical protein
MNHKVSSATLGLLILLASAFSATAQDEPPGGIKLLPGYQHRREQGIDTLVGKIWKDGGQTITYDIGCLAGHYADRKHMKDFSWYKEVTIEGHEFRIARFKTGGFMSGILVVTIPGASANFFAPAKTEEEVADALLMLTTYRGKIDCEKFLSN